MPIRPVLLFPDPRLKETAPEADLASTTWQAVLRDLVDTMRHHPGCVGLAAPQIGHSLRCLVVDVSRSFRAGTNNGLLQLVNPRIMEASQWKVGREGCLSFPDLLANVKRARKLRLAGWNEKGESVEFTTLDFEAVALQHEIDHLNGLLFLDRIRSSHDLFERRKSTLPV